MAARLGANTALISEVGDDTFGGNIMDNLRTNAVQVEHVRISKEAPTGAAHIAVDQKGANRLIQVSHEAGLTVTEKDVRRAQSKIAKATVLLCQLEIPQAAVLEAMRIAERHRVLTIFNPSPRSRVRAGISQEMYALTDVICLNEPEDQVDWALMQLLQRGPTLVIITLGEHGCAFVSKDDGKIRRVKAAKVNVVDTTGAGDAFLGSLAYFVACRSALPLEEQIRRCCYIAGMTVGKRGSQRSYPGREEIGRELLECGAVLY